mgnify:FL=1|jgi:23S rRNA (adenine2503-C2)-methyltransferase
MTESKTDIRLFNLGQLQAQLGKYNWPKFRAKQIYHWLWKKHVRSFGEMNNLPKDIIEGLENNFEILPIRVKDQQVSDDGTIKSAFETADKKIVEGVLIPTEKRMTACISSQIGCSLACSFCATGKLKRLRNLTASEIVDQVVEINNQATTNYQKSLTNIVLMGMGEPLLNYSEVMKGIDMITSEDGLGMSPRRITLSTAGISKMIRKMGDDMSRINLALSLHAANDEKRSKIMAINDQNNLDELAEAMIYYYSKTKQMLTFEYIIFKDFNDSLDDARDLARFCKRVPSKVNIIEYNSTDDEQFAKSPEDRVDAFVEFLTKQKIVAKVRRSRGQDIDAACGQLANKNKAELK